MKTPFMDKIIFLDYLSRSGSTLLASRLNDIVGCEVTIETRITKSYDPFEIKIKNKNNINKFLTFFNTYKKNKVWNLNSSDLISCLTHKKTIRYYDLVKEILKKRNHDFSKETIVVKGGGNYIINYKRYAKKVENLKIICLYRDPRAIYNSQLKSKDSHLKQPMAKGIYDFCFMFNRYKTNLRRYSSSNILVVSFNELVLNPENILEKCTDFLEINNKITENNNYFESIPESQKHLHENIKSKKGMIEKIDLWKEDLPIKYKRIIEVICFGENSSNSLVSLVFYYRILFTYSIYFLKNIISINYKYLKNEI